MRRVIVFLTSLVLALVTAAGTARADTGNFRGPQPANLKASAATTVATPGTLVPVAGVLRDAAGRPLGGQPVLVAVGAGHESALESLTGSDGAFEAYATLPDAEPASGLSELTVTFPGNLDAAASSVTLQVRVQAPAEVGTEEAPAGAPAPKAPATTTQAGLPTSGSPIIDQLILVAGGLLGVVVVLLAVGAGLRRRRA